MIIVGDAAHASESYRLDQPTAHLGAEINLESPVLPHQGQGASQALEDAEALGAFLRGVTPEGVPDALQRVFSVRYARASMTQQNSRMGRLDRKAEDGAAKASIKALDPMQFRDFSWKYFGAERWEKEQPEFVLS